MTGPAAPRPGISVVLPVRDDAPALRSCLAALARQDRPADEIVVVDNGSSDDLLAVIAAAERDQDLPLRLLQEPRPGVSFAAHAGYDAASHQIIARCDADSIPPSSWLARIERQLAAEDDKLVAITGAGASPPGLARWADRCAASTWGSTASPPDWPWPTRRCGAPTWPCAPHGGTGSAHDSLRARASMTTSS